MDDEEARNPQLVDADEACALLSVATHQYLDVRLIISILDGRFLYSIYFSAGNYQLLLPV